jgi:hypothetical protein
MAKRHTHPDVEFMVLDGGGRERYFKDFDEAAAFVIRGAIQDGTWRNLSVLVHSEDGARWYGGADGAELYRSDPDASVFEQMAVKVDSRGMMH